MQHFYKLKWFFRSYAIVVLLLFSNTAIYGQNHEISNQWIRPESAEDAALWGIRNGIVFALWPYGIETEKSRYGGGPRGLVRMGFERDGKKYLLNFLAIEPIVKGKIEFSEISPSMVDGKWGKLMWASDEEASTSFSPMANSRGVISRPDPKNPAIEELSVYVFLEKFISGAHPYLRLSIRNDRPEEICVEVFNREDSELMDFCNITATMGNYSRLRQIHLKNKIIDARKLYTDYKGIDFVEKESYAADALIQSKGGDYFAFATTNESLEELMDWPTDSLAERRRSWRYRPSVKLTQYWRKENPNPKNNLHLRVNGRYRYWSGGSRDESLYMEIPGGASFENFELQEKYHQGQKLYYGISKDMPAQILDNFNAKHH
ncbi:hypothetical protein H8S90_02875 [Olivibacter sp. SDN3]|uniref:hypothetical protein n=1 Tax=Olivibacter sp. SDN3 TaxID=2764720 RepID=UPI0016511D7B|nr:hypothetical protein [Olivibacter sp. SDN3]QNL50567.1 hypothetical protein H8S90_02875 [Olivibacter sp. SDN3]